MLQIGFCKIFIVVFSFNTTMFYSFKFYHYSKHKFRNSFSFLQVIGPAASSAFSIFPVWRHCLFFQFHNILKYSFSFKIYSVLLGFGSCVMFFNLYFFLRVCISQNASNPQFGELCVYFPVCCFNVFFFLSNLLRVIVGVVRFSIAKYKFVIYTVLRYISSI